MSNQLRSPYERTEEEEEEIRAVMGYMTGEEGLEVFTRELREKGIKLPESSMWKYAKRRDIEAAVHATFSLLGGVPGMVLWASKNPNLFYPAYIKLAPVETTLNGAGNVFINTAVPESPLDTVEIDKFGRIKGVIEK